MPLAVRSRNVHANLPTNRHGTTHESNSNIITNNDISSPDDSDGKGLKKNRQQFSIQTVYATMRRTWWQLNRNNSNGAFTDVIVPMTLFIAGVLFLLFAVHALSTSSFTSNGDIPKRTVSMAHPHSSDAQLFLEQFRGFEFFSENTNDIFVQSPHPDYGGLQINFLDEGQERNIQLDPLALHGHLWTESEFQKDNWEEYYAFDDDYVRNIPFKESNKTCRRLPWHRNYFPNCNVFHEIEIIKGENRYLGEGAYREAYLQHETFDPQLVVKVQRYRHNPFITDRYEFIRMDALVMERLTSSPRIADIYGHCATSIYSEFLPNEAEEFIVLGEGDGENLNDEDDVKPNNNYTISEKLDMALQMAESIADLHGFKDGVLVHDDIQLAQFLFAPDGRLKLNDFNRAEVMLFDEEDGSYCKYQNGKGAGEYRAPEEFEDGWLDQGIDVWSLGNNIYALITGLWPMYHIDEMKEKRKALMDGEISYLDPRYNGKNYIQDRLIEIMLRCWILKPEDRADVFEVSAFLRKTLDGAKKEGIYDGRF